MKRTAITIVALFLAAASVLAQNSVKETKPEDSPNLKQFKNKVFEIHNRDPRNIAETVRLLGSGAQGSAMNVNHELHTITVRDFPENIATIGEAISRLDRPTEDSPNIELRTWILLGAKTAIEGPPVPEELAPALKELTSALRFSHFALLTSGIQRIKPGPGVVEESGVAQQAILGTSSHPDQPAVYSYRIHNISVGRSGDHPSVTIDDFEFKMRFPIDLGTGGTQYQSVGFNTPVTIRSGETVVLGTTTMVDRALMVVVSAALK